MIFKRFSDKIFVFNLFGRTELNITVYTDSKSASEHVIPSTDHKPDVPIEDPKKCPICHNVECSCDSSGDGGFVL